MTWSAPHAALRERPSFVIRDVARTMRARTEEQLREVGLTWTSFPLLLVVARAGALSQQALAGRAVLAEAEAGVERGEREALRGLTARERGRLHTLLDRLVRDDRPAFFKRWA